MLLVVFFTGCTTFKPNKETTVVYKTQTILLAPTPELLRNVDYVQPPDKLQYMKATSKERESMLVDLYLEQNKTINQCNRTIDGIRDWVKNESNKYDKAKK